MSNEYYSSYEHVHVIGDGDMLCARFHDFENLQESPAGFGKTEAEALDDLAHRTRVDRQRWVEQQQQEIARLRGIVDKPRRFPRQEGKQGGWTISTKYLKRIERIIDKLSSEGWQHDVCWEDIETVCLAIEAAEAAKEAGDV